MSVTGIPIPQPGTPEPSIPTFAVTTDRSEYSRFETTRSIILARVTAPPLDTETTIDLSLCRATGTEMVKQTITANAGAALIQIVQFDLTAIVDTDRTPLCARGYYYIAATRNGVTVRTSVLRVSIITAEEFRQSYCRGLPLLAHSLLTPINQPAVVTGVTIRQVSEQTRRGFKPLVFNSADQTLQYDSGPAIPIGNSSEILPGKNGDYVIVAIQSYQLPTEDAAESILIDKQTISDEMLQADLDRAVSEMEKDLDFYLEPMRVATEPYFSAPETGEWFDKKREPLCYYQKDFNMRGMGWHLDLAIHQLIKVDKLQGFIGDAKCLEITTGGYSVNRKAGMLDVMPYASQYAINYLFFVQLQYWGNREFIAGFWRWKGKAGIERLEDDLLKAIGYKAAIPVLISAGQAARAGAMSESISKDGVSASTSVGQYGPYTAAIQSYQDWFKTEFPNVKKRYRGIGMVIL